MRYYDPREADQIVESERPDLLPPDAGLRAELMRRKAHEAVVYGLPSVYQYASMCAQCAPATPDGDWALNTFVHERDLAKPGYGAFRVPNVDTLYSNAWVDLSAGPVAIDIPDFGDRYYTLNLFDAYSNASNISARTYPGVRRFLLVVDGWQGSMPDDRTVVVVASVVTWILMRVQIMSADDAGEVHRLQDAVAIAGLGDTVRPAWPIVTQAGVESDATEFLRSLDASLTINGCPESDRSHVHGFRSLGVVGGTAGAGDGPAVRSGFDDAMAALDRMRPSLGERMGTGWTKVLDKGVHGMNFLARAVMNFVGLGANVVEENCSYNTYVDADGEILSGEQSTYVIDFVDLPPVNAFWSVTLYVGATGHLYDAPGAAYSMGSGGDSTRERAEISTGLRIVVSHRDPGEGDPWLPCPEQPFFLVLRMYEPREDALSGRWIPPSVVAVR